RGHARLACEPGAGHRGGVRGSSEGHQERGDRAPRVAAVRERQRLGHGLRVGGRRDVTASIPGTDVEFIEVRDDSGRLIELSAGGRRYVWVEDDGRHYDGGVTMFEAAFGQ